MSRDFLSNQIRVNKVIGNSSGALPKISLYPDTNATDSVGGTQSTLFNNVGDDVFLYVSGTPDGKANSTSKSVSLFGGDVVISGTLYAEKQIIEVDTVQTSSLSVSGSISHTGGINIGDAEDSDYTDGLFTDFSSNTFVGTAIDRFNEVLKGLAPRQAPELKDASFSPSVNNGFDAYLSFGVSNDQSSSGYNNVTAIANTGYNAVDVNGLYEDEAISTVNDKRNFKLGVFRKTTEFNGILNDNQLGDTYTNSIVNYPNDSFSSSNQGSLKLYLNGNLLHEIDLTDVNIGAGNPGSGTGSYLNSNGSGFYDLSVTSPGKFASEQTFQTFQHRTGKWKVSAADQTDGFNYVQVKHEISGQTDKTTGFGQWVNDSNSDSLSVLSRSLTLNLTGSKHLSGVEYFTGGNSVYSGSIANFYKFVYGNTPVSFNTTQSPAGASLSFSNFAIPQINTATEDHTKNLDVTATSSITLPGSGRILTYNTGFTVNSGITHPYKTLATNLTESSATQIFIDNASTSSTAVLENFDDEDYRLKSTTYSNQSDITNAANTWDSTQQIITGNTGYDDGLLVYDGKLRSTKNSSLVNSGNFSTLTNGPSGNPDYSNGNIASNVKRYIRKFTNNSGNVIRDISYQILGSGNIKNDSFTLGSNNNNFKLYFKSPGDTAWLDAATDFTYNSVSSDGDGGKIGSFTESISGNPTNYLTFGTAELANGESILMKVESNKTWQGDIDSVQVAFGVVGNVNPSPDTDDLDMNNTGATGKLSFGTTLTKTGYTNVSSIGGSNARNSNDDYTVTSFSNNDRRGFFDGNTTLAGEINEDVTASGNSYPANAWGSGKAHIGELKLEVNGSIIAACTINLASFGSGDSLNANNTGFTNISTATVSRDSNNLPDYRYFYRTGSYRIHSADQRSGWNYARVIHDIDGGTNVFETNYVEWVNSNSSLISFSSLTIDNSSIVQGSTAPNYLSGINYFSSAKANFSLTAANVYKYVYSSSGSAITFPTTTNSTVESITVNGNGVINGVVNSSSRSLPNLDTSVSTAHDENIEVEASFRFDINKSLPGSLQNATLNCRIDHPVNGNTTSSSQTSANPLIYTVADTETDLVENFSAESYRLQSGVYANQTDISGGSWNSSESLVGANASYNTGLQFFDNKLIAPSQNFNNTASLIGPVNNPDYSTAAGVRTFFRKFENTTSNSQFGFELRIKGNGTSIVNNTVSLTTNNIKVFAKIPNTSNSQTTGFMDLALAFNTGQTSNNDGCLQGTFTSAIVNTGNGTSNNVTFGTKFLSPGDFVVIKIEADSSWTGDLNRIEVVWS